MIYTVTFNPAIDYVVYMPNFQNGMVNRTRKEELFFGGKGINVATVLQRLGVETAALGFLAGFTGRAIEQGLQQMGIHTDFIHLPEGLTRINVKIKADGETEINGRGPDIDEASLDTLLHKLDTLEPDDMLVLAGSIPQSLPDTIYEQILKRLQGRDIRPVVDAEGKLLCQVLPYRPFLVKPNHIELSDIFGRTLQTDEEIEESARMLQQRGARNVLVSMAAKGALLLDETGAVHRMGVPTGKTRNSVGAGDSMVAGFLAGYLETGDYAHALRMGTAAGSATAFSEGLATKEDILQLLQTL